MEISILTCGLQFYRTKWFPLIPILGHCNLWKKCLLCYHLAWILSHPMVLLTFVKLIQAWPKYSQSLFAQTSHVICIGSLFQLCNNMSTCWHSGLRRELLLQCVRQWQASRRVMVKGSLRQACTGSLCSFSILVNSGTFCSFYVQFLDPPYIPLCTLWNTLWYTTLKHCITSMYGITS